MESASHIARQLAKAGYQTFLVGRAMHRYPLRKRYGFEHMVIQMSDMEGEDYRAMLARNAPSGHGGHRGAGITHNDWTARIPFLIQGPGLPAGQVLDAPVCLEDIMPTVLDLAGVRIPASVDGQSVVPLLAGKQTAWRPYLHGEHAGTAHFLIDGVEKYIWFAADGREQFFNLKDDPTECHDLARSGKASKRVAFWRQRLIEQLRGRPEGFTDGKKLIPGRRYEPVIPGHPKN